MSSDKKKQKVTFERHIPLHACADYLTAIADGLRAGRLTFKTGDELVTLPSAPTIATEMKAKRKPGSSSLSIQLTWSHAPNTEPRVVPGASTGAAPDHAVAVAATADAVANGNPDPSLRDTDPQFPKPEEPSDAQKRAWLAELSREELYAKAQDLELPGRSQMTKDDLIRGLATHHPVTALFTHDELYARAQQAGVAGRSTMNKHELLHAL